MEWSKTKTIFILAFLILDIYLAIEFFQFRVESNLKNIPSSTIEEQIKAEGIEVSNLPKNRDKGFYITAKSKNFALDEISKLKNQSQVLTNNDTSAGPFQTISMQLKEPFPLPDVNLESKINQFLTENVISGELYHYWYTDEQTNSIICIQQFKGDNIFQTKEDHIAMIIFSVNENNEIFSYEQSMLEDITEVEEKETTIPAFKAIEALFVENYLGTKDKVIQTKYGYYTHIPLSNQQILAPTWYITIESEKGEQEDYYVNALDGDVLQSVE